mmetsp:Transcript_9237/g.23779  ORF Transcript_9237/g.23779 Transcript_9237/m.23779 type:complete len:346 (+) Transcript_9237:172-1209(+)
MLRPDVAPLPHQRPHGSGACLLLHAARDGGHVLLHTVVQRLELAGLGDGKELRAGVGQQAAVVADEHKAAVEVVQCRAQRVDRLHVQVVGRLVEQQDVRGHLEQERKAQPDFLPAGQRAHRLNAQAPPQPEARQEGARLLLLDAEALAEQVHAAHGRQRRGQELVDAVLREVAEPQVVVPPHLPAQRLGGAGDGRQQRRLAPAVAAENADPAAEVHLHGDAGHDRRSLGIPAHRHVFQLQHRTVVAQRLRRGQTEPKPRLQRRPGTGLSPLAQSRELLPARRCLFEPLVVAALARLGHHRLDASRHRRLAGLHRRTGRLRGRRLLRHRLRVVRECHAGEGLQPLP